MRDSLKIRAIGWLSAMLVAILAGPTHAVDLLELPAIQSEAASRGLLLDATARGEGALVAVGSFGVIIKSEDGGATWTQASVPASVTLTAVDFPTPEKGWAVGHDGLKDGTVVRLVGEAAAAADTLALADGAADTTGGGGSRGVSP